MISCEHSASFFPSSSSSVSSSSQSMQYLWMCVCVSHNDRMIHNVQLVSLEIITKWCLLNSRISNTRPMTKKDEFISLIFIHILKAWMNGLRNYCMYVINFMMIDPTPKLKSYCAEKKSRKNKPIEWRHTKKKASQTIAAHVCIYITDQKREQVITAESTRANT